MKHLKVDLVKDTHGKVSSTQAKFLATTSRQNKFADLKVRDMEFQTGENVLLRVYHP